MSTNITDLLRAIEAARETTHDCMILPPGAIGIMRESTAAEINLRREAALPTLFMGMRVIESVFARAPARRHKKRRGMSEAYHRRIQKKWNKRFGYVPAALLLNTAVLDLCRSLPPILKRDLAAFDADNQIIVMAGMT